ncbi:MAG: insulinase family protein [Candidatus Saccharimonadales bacterium]
MQHTVEEVTLSNGTSGLLIDVPGSKVVSLQLYFNSGFLLADPAKYEMPHITEHLLIAGNEDYPDSMEYKRQLELNGAVFNASTNIDYNCYYWQCASFEVERILGLASAQIGRPLIRARRM